jgi:hypothetical protein
MGWFQRVRSALDGACWLVRKTGLRAGLEALPAEMDRQRALTEQQIAKLPVEIDQVKLAIGVQCQPRPSRG